MRMIMWSHDHLCCLKNSANVFLRRIQYFQTMSGKNFKGKNKFTGTSFSFFHQATDHFQTSTLTDHSTSPFDHIFNASFSGSVGSGYLSGDNMFSNFTPNTDLVPLIMGYEKSAAAFSEIKSIQNRTIFNYPFILKSTQ